MANLDQLESSVSELIKEESEPFEFNAVFADIESAARTTGDADVARLAAIVNDFLGRLTNLIELNPVRARANDLADILMLARLQDRISRINARNEALAQLTSELESQIKKANADATRLKSITDGVEKATKTVNEAKSIVDSLTATDKSTKDKLKELIEGLGAISNILNPPSA